MLIREPISGRFQIIMVLGHLRKKVVILDVL